MFLCLHFWCSKFPSAIISLLSEELPLAIFLKQVCSQQLLIVCVHLRMSLSHLKSWGTLSLIKSSESSVLFFQHFKDVIPHPSDTTHRGKEPRTSQTTWQSDHPKLFCLLSPRHAPIPQAALSRLQPETAPFPPCSGLCRARQRKKKKIITTGLVTLSWSHTSAEGEETSPPFKFWLLLVSHFPVVLSGGYFMI